MELLGRFHQFEFIRTEICQPNCKTIFTIYTFDNAPGICLWRNMDNGAFITDLRGTFYAFIAIIMPVGLTQFCHPNYIIFVKVSHSMNLFYFNPYAMHDCGEAGSSSSGAGKHVGGSAGVDPGFIQIDPPAFGQANHAGNDVFR